MRNGREENLDAVLDDILDAVQATLSHFESFGMHFDAKTTGQIFPFEWPALDRPFHEYKRLLEFAITSGDTESLLSLLYWPFKVMKVSIDADDHFFYQQAVNHFPYFYALARNDLPARQRQLMMNRSWTYMKEFGRFELTYRLREASDEARVEALASYWKELFGAYVGLLRTAMDETDVDYFKEAARGFWRALDLHYASSDLSLTIDLTRRDPIVGRLSEDDFDEVKAKNIVAIADRRDALWFALGAWLCLRWQNSEVRPENASELFTIIVEPFNSLGRTWRAFATAMQAESSDRLPLSDWELSRLEPERVHSMDSAYYLAVFFVATLLPQLSPTDETQVERLAEMHEASWVGNHVERAIKEVQEAPDKWARLAGEAVRDEWRFAAITRLMNASKSAEDEKERRVIMDQNISPTKIAEFKGEFLADWYAQSMFRRIFHAAGKITYAPGSHPDRTVLGLAVSLPKSAFVEDAGRIHWIGVAENFSRGIAQSENAVVLDKLVNGAEVLEVPRDGVVESLAAAVRSASSYEVLVLTGHGWKTLELLHKSSRFIPHYAGAEALDPDVDGLFDGVPVYTSGDLDENQFLVVNLASLGNIRQYLGEGDSMFRRFSIEEYTEEELAKLKAGEPSQLPDEVKSLSDEEQQDYLREHVSVVIEESLDFDLGDAPTISLLKIAAD